MSIGQPSKKGGKKKGSLRLRHRTPIFYFFSQIKSFRQEQSTSGFLSIYLKAIYEQKNERNWFFKSCPEIKILVDFSWPSLLSSFKLYSRWVPLKDTILIGNWKYNYEGSRWREAIDFKNNPSYYNLSVCFTNAICILTVTQSKTSASVSSGVPDTEKQVKARGCRPSAFIVTRCLEPLMKHEARVFDTASQTSVRIEWNYFQRIGN